MASNPIPVDLAALFGEPHDEDERPIINPDIDAAVLRDLAAAYLAPQAPFRVGDVVTWREPAFRNARFDIGIVVEIVGDAQPQTETGDGHFREVYDLCLMIRIGDGGEAVTIGADSRRLRLMTEAELRIVPAAIPSAA